ncbi:MAG: hypothetical protein R3B67_07375 [Phycisphaerales bacterium]
MSNTNIRSVRVLRYAADGGYAAVEWLRAFESVEIPHAISDGDAWRIGVQITKKRVIDVILRIETLDGFGDRLRARFKRTESDGLYTHPGRCVAQIRGAGRPLAMLGARHMGVPVRILVCAAES